MKLVHAQAILNATLRNTCVACRFEEKENSNMIVLVFSTAERDFKVEGKQEDFLSKSADEWKRMGLYALRKFIDGAKKPGTF